MAIPSHEEDPDKKKSSGHNRPISSGDLTLQRILKIGELMYAQRMDMAAIYTWNNEPAQVATGWGYTYRHIHRLCKRSKQLGASLLCRNYEEALRTTMKEWEVILVKSLEIGDMRSACFAQAKMSDIRMANIGRALNGKSPHRALMQWEVIDKALPTVFSEIQNQNEIIDKAENQNDTNE